MNTEDYIDHLQSELKGFSAQERAALIEEVTTHIEEGQDDTRLGHDKQERSKKIEAEMGSPNDLGRRFKEIHRPNRWIDFLLVFLPSEFVKYFILVILSIALSNLSPINSSWASEPHIMASIRISFLLSILMVVVAKQRKSLALLFFWLPQGLITAFTLFFREKRWEPLSPFNVPLVGKVESLFWLILFLFIVFWLIYLSWTNRHEPQFIVLALIPLLITAANTTLGRYISTGYFPGGYQLPNWNLVVIFGFPLGLYQISVILWPLLFYVSRNRQVRWLGLFLYAVPLSLMNLVASSTNVVVAAIWIIPFIFIMVSWLFDMMKFPHRPKLVS